MGLGLETLNRNVIDRMKHKIISMEGVNLKTKAKTDAEMVKEIKKRIEEAVNAAQNN